MRVIRVNLMVMLILLFIAILAGFLFFLSAGVAKDRIVAEIRHQTGYVISAENVRWTISPALGLRMPQVVISHEQTPRPIAYINDMKVIMPLSSILGTSKKRVGAIYMDSIVLGNNLHGTAIDIKFDWQDNVLTIKPILANLYGGVLTASVHSTSLSHGPTVWNWSLWLSFVDISQLWLDLYGNTKLKLMGSSDVKFVGQSYFQSGKSFIETLSGKTSFTIYNGAIDGIDLNYFVELADQLISKQSAPLKMTTQTKFDKLTGHGQITNGVLNFSEMILAARSFKANSMGNINLVDGTLGLNMLIASQQIIKTGWSIPLLIQGPLNKPGVQLDHAALQKIMVKKELDKIKDKTKKELKRGPIKAQQFLNRFFSH